MRSARRVKVSRSDSVSDDDSADSLFTHEWAGFKHAPLLNPAALSSPAFNVQRYDLTEVNRFLCDRLMLCAGLLFLLPSLASFTDSSSLNACMFPQSSPD